MTKECKFQVQTQLSYGAGFSRKLPDFLEQKGFKKVTMLIDPGVEKSAYYKEIIGLLKQSSTALTVLVLRGNEEPDYDYLDEIAGKVRETQDLDALIGIGGGSVLDTTKAVAVLKTNPGKGIQYRGFDHVKVPGVPTIAIPSTAGTASEVTINAVFIDKKEMKKLGINGRYLNATYAILDAEWTISAPESVAVSSGVDALVHSLESFMCHQANPVTRVFSREAFALLYRNLPAIINDPQNIEARQQLLLGSYLAGIALFNSGSGISGALSYPLGVHYKIPHGIGGGIFIAEVIEYNVNKGYTGYAELLDLIEQHPEMSLAEKNQQFVRVLKALKAKLKVPQYLNQWGVTKENVEEVAKLMQPLQAAFDQNPVPFSATSDALAMLKQHVSA